MLAAGGEGVRPAQETRVGLRTLVGVQLETAGVGPASGPTRRPFSLEDGLQQRRLQGGQRGPQQLDQLLERAGLRLVQAGPQDLPPPPPPPPAGELDNDRPPPRLRRWSHYQISRAPLCSFDRESLRRYTGRRVVMTLPPGGAQDQREQRLAVPRLRAGLLQQHRARDDHRTLPRERC